MGLTNGFSNFIQLKKGFFMSAWHVRAGGKVVGPVTSSQLKSAVEAGKIPASAQVKKDGTDDWQPISKMKGLSWPEVIVEPEGLIPAPQSAMTSPPPLPQPTYDPAPIYSMPQQALPQTIVNVQMAAPVTRRWSRGTAILLSLLVPGLGQMYKGQVINGIVWLMVTICGYIAFVIPGMILHVFCMIGAASGDETR
jgi:hypothetical protein